MGKIITIAIAGLGSRGKDTYAQATQLFPNKMKIVAIADTDKEKVVDVAKTYNIAPDKCFTSAEEMMAQDQLADVLILATQDQQHVPQAIPALKKGYHILLEKPISPDLEACRALVKVAKIYNRHVIVCHVLRYTPIFSKLKELLDSGTIGDVASVMSIENVGYWHQAHSFVRGNWNNAHTTSPMILQKCCHDMDLLLWLTNKTCKAVSSYGDTYHFKKQKAPEGATRRCLDGCKAKATCPYDAEKIYMDHERIGVRKGHRTWPLDVLTLHPNEESIYTAIKEGPYGRCVYYCDNNVVDHQVVNMQMTDGSTMSHTMSGFTATGTRYMKIMGTKGEVIADMTSSVNSILITRFGEATEVIDMNKLASDFSGHGGGDNKMLEEFIDMICEGNEPNFRTTSIERSVESHYVALAAEASRLKNGESILLDTYRS